MSKNLRISIAALSLSAAGFVGMLIREGYSDSAIIPTKGDVPTVGFGTTGGVKLGDTTTPVKAAVRALQDSQQYEGTMKRCVRVPLHQAEYDLYAHTAYNIGPTAFCSSTLVRKLNQQDYLGACAQILEWKMFKGTDCSQPNKVCAGLWTDRRATHAKCMGAQQS